MSDWTGNGQSSFTTIGAKGHTEKERATNDYYATDPAAVDYLIAAGAKLSHELWECACGAGHLSKKLLAYGYDVKSTDLIYRGFGSGGVDFLKQTNCFDGDIITNPPYKYAHEFVNKALELIPEGHKVFMFLKLQFLEGKSRKALFDTRQLKTVYVSRSRIKCAPNGKFEEITSSAVAYAWYEFEKGFNGDPKIVWIN